MAKDREFAIRLSESYKRLDISISALWDARNRGDKEDFEFYQQSVARCAKSITEWVLKLEPKEKNNDQKET